MTKSPFHNKICFRFFLLIAQNNIHTCASVPVFCTVHSSVANKGSCGKRKRRCWPHQEPDGGKSCLLLTQESQWSRAVDSLEVLTECATFWRLKVYGMGSLSGIGGAESSGNGRRDEATAKVETPPVEEIQQVARRCSTLRPLQLYSGGVC